METFIVVLHIFVAILLILAVLLQAGKGTEIGATFGGSSNTLFGASGGSNFFTKFTTATAIIFMITSITLTIMKSKSFKKSIMNDVKVETPAAPAVPAAPSTAPVTTQPKEAQNAPDKK